MTQDSGTETLTSHERLCILSKTCHTRISISSRGTSMAANLVQKKFLTRDHAISILLASLFKRAPEGTGVSYSLIEENESLFSFSAAFVDGDSEHLHKPV